MFKMHVQYILCIDFITNSNITEVEQLQENTKMLRAALTHSTEKNGDRLYMYSMHLAQEACQINEINGFQLQRQPCACMATGRISCLSCFHVLLFDA